MVLSNISKLKGLGTNRSLYLLILLCSSTFLSSQEPENWDEEEIAEVFSGLHVDAGPAIASVEAKGVTPYDFGLDLVDAGMPEKAIEWYRTLGIATKDPQYLYGLAWVKWKTGDYAGAVKDAYFLIHKDPPPLIRARTYYLLGSVNLEQRRLTDAKRELHMGLETYKAIPNKFGGQYLCLTLLAAVAIHQHKFDEVGALLDQALEANEKLESIGLKPYGQGRYFEILGEMHFWKAEYRAALDTTQQARKAYEADGRTMASDGALVKIGMLKLILGELQEAHAVSAEIWEKYHTNPNAGRILAYNNITIAKISKCAQHEEDYQARSNSVLSWANSVPGGRAVIELFEFLLVSIPCPEL